MRELLNKIEAHAAARLSLPAGRTVTQELARYKSFLKLETHRLKMLHRAGGGGLLICQARAAILDVLLRHLWEAAKIPPPARTEGKFPPLALVAIGGYGRAELNPFSDIDLMFLHAGRAGDRRAAPPLTRLVDGVLYPLWDLGLKIGHSVRTIVECVKEANRDMRCKTSLIESRVVVGDAALFRHFQQTLLRRCVQGREPEYIAMRLADQAARRAKFGNSASMQEPNVKNGCGGLRDYQNLLWMAFFKYRARSLADLSRQDLLREAERKQLERAYDFLLRTRTEMHYHAHRATEVLAKNLQPAIAHNLGWRERSPSRRIEKFMREFYSHSRNIFLITRTLEQRLALQPQPGASRRGRAAETRAPAGEPFDGFRLADGQIHALSPAVFREQPRRLMRVFLHAQQRGAELHPDLVQLIRGHVHLADQAFLADPHVSETFLTILNQRGSVGRVLRAMHEADLLGKYLPEFGRLTCLVQHEFYHQYTADEHTLVCLEQLDQVWEAAEPPRQAYTPLFQSLQKPFVLYLALLLHDTGKPKVRGGHPAASAQMAARAARRLGLDGATAHLLRLIIEHHLLMAEVSQRRDLDDPAVIRKFARQVQTLEAVTLITLLTFVDAQATSDQLWNGFKDSLLWELHFRAARLMSGGAEFLLAEEKRRELLREQCERERPRELPAEELRAHFEALPLRYFQIHTAAEVLEDARLVHQFLRLQSSDTDNPLAPVMLRRDEPDRGCTVLKFCTWDRAGLFSRIAGSLSAVGLNILSARIYTRADNLVLDTFLVIDARSGSLASAAQCDQARQILTECLTGQPVDLGALIARQKITRPLYAAYTGEHIPTQARFEEDVSDVRTLIEVEAEDRVGLLYAISQTLTDLGLDISTARISTERGAAIDSFYVREVKGGKINDPQRERLIQHRLHQAIARLGAV